MNKKQYLYLKLIFDFLIFILAIIIDYFEQFLKIIVLIFLLRQILKLVIKLRAR